MNKNTKRSIVFLILSASMPLVGFLAYCLSAYIISESAEVSTDGDWGAFFANLATMFNVMIAAFIILVVTAIAIYIFANFAHEYAKNAITELTESGDSLRLPKALRVISVIVLTLSAIAALLPLLIIIAASIL